eukprot:TRINITY_DN40855_c0_g1_i1.p1 TRINITY_DN40855_c0_g1~~TRINITY_DN40855_c0_g1_i1.p1  ORF type:complete len:669 (-),score=100.67 TRINITY_DN40855_c0_g1_i1:206-2212(-)
MSRGIAFLTLLLCRAAKGFSAQTAVHEAVVADATFQGNECSSFMQRTVGIFNAAAEEAQAEAEPMNPDFGPNVIIVEPGLESGEVEVLMQPLLQAALVTANGAGNTLSVQFSDHRLAVLLKPGTHNFDLDLPYYSTVHGLGTGPAGTVVKPGPQKAGLRVEHLGENSSLNTFWRGVENVHLAMDAVKWHVSQAAPMRSVIVDGDLQLSGPDPDWSSGGCLSNSKVKGRVLTGTQQQWYTKSTAMQPYQSKATVGSYMCIGCIGLDGKPYTVTYSWNQSQSNGSNSAQHMGASYTEAPEVSAEKPHIFFDSVKGGFFLRIPEVTENRSGPDWQTGSTVSFKRVYVAKNATATADLLNEKLAAGLHIVFTPGIYVLDKPVEVKNPGTVLLGLGFATLIPSFDGESLIKVGNVDGVHIAGLILQAGSETLGTTALLQWGEEGSDYEGSRENPGFIHDLVARAGGPDNAAVGVKYFVQINNGWVIGDDIWLWKADHCLRNSGVLCIPTRHVDTALEVNGANVHMYGLMAEHTDKDIVVWNGEHGRTFFYQSEFRYDGGPKPHVFAKVEEEDVHPVSYRINAEDHRGVGFGIYVVVYAPESTSTFPEMQAVRQASGLRCISVTRNQTYSQGLRDVQCMNWNASWPVSSRLTCKVWNDAENACLSEDIANLHNK